MSDLVLNALRRNLEIHADDSDKVSRIKKRITTLEKATSEDLGDRTKAELLEIAAEKGVDASPSMKKAELVEALNEGDT